MAAFFLAWLALFMEAFQAYQGSTAVFTAFSVVSLGLLVSAFYRSGSYGYTFLAMFLWLGFWNKLSWKLVGFVGFAEPTGLFVDTAESWDEVLTVATTALVGVMASRFVRGLLGWRSTLTVSDAACASTKIEARSLHSLADLNPCLMTLFVVTVLGLVWVNVCYGISMVGVTTRTVLPWRLNALISLMLMGGGGLTIWAGAIIWWQTESRRPVFSYVILYVLCSIVVAAGSLSRLTVVSYAIPFMCALYINRRRIIDFSLLRSVVIAIALGMAVAASFFVADQLRHAVYSNKLKESQPVVTKPGLGFFSNANSKVTSLMVFSVIRWVGIEGVMAVSAYPKKSPRLLLEAILERPTSGEPALYEKVAPFPKIENMKPGIALSSTPGGVGFLYYSGSLFFVFLISFILSLSLQKVEVGVYRLTKNPLLCASTGFLMATIFAHQWGMPYYAIPFMGFVIFCLVFVAIVQRIRLIRLSSVGSFLRKS